MTKLVEFVKKVWAGLIAMIKSLVNSAKEITEGALKLLPPLLIILGTYNLLFKQGAGILRVVNLAMQILGKVGITTQVLSVAILIIVGYKVIEKRLK